VGGADRADAAPIGQAGGDVVDDGVQLRAVGLECVGGLAERQGESADLGVPNCLMAVGVAGLSTPGQGGENGVGERAAGGLAVGVVAAQQQGAQAVGLRSAAGGEFAAGAEQDPQRFPVAVGSGGSLSASRRSAVITARCASVAPAAGLAVGLPALDHGQAGGNDRAAEPDAVAAGALDGHD
jgi:hypothetical protein